MVRDWYKCLLLRVVRLLLTSLLRVRVSLLVGRGRSWVAALSWWRLVGHVGDSVLATVHVWVVCHWHLVVPRVSLIGWVWGSLGLGGSGGHRRGVGAGRGVAAGGSTAGRGGSCSCLGSDAGRWGSGRRSGFGLIWLGKNGSWSWSWAGAGGGSWAALIGWNVE